jgi:hypothetical protein
MMFKEGVYGLAEINGEAAILTAAAVEDVRRNGARER